MKTIILRDAFVVTETIVRNFNAKTASSDSGCLIWRGAMNSNGYGKVKIGGLAMDAHVASWRITNLGAPVPLDCVVMHSCDNRLCVNESHLSIGTQSENMMDASRKGRLRDQKLNPSIPPILGADSIERVLELSRQGFSSHRISMLLGVSWACMQRFMKRHNLKLPRKYFVATKH